METVMDAPVVSLTTTPHINKVDASAKVEATIEFDDDEVQPNTDKDWISYLNKHSSSITWYFNDEYSDL